MHLSGEPGRDVISRGVRIEKALEEHAMLVWGMNGEDLPHIHGGPLRVMIPGWPRSASHKWVNRIVLRDVEHDGPGMTGTSYRVPATPVIPGQEPDAPRCRAGGLMQMIRPLKSLMWMAALCVAIPAAAFAFDDPEDLPEGEGREDAFYNCIACRSFQVVVRQGMSRPMWDDTLTLMVERHGMWEMDEEERTLVLDYLSEHYPPTVSTGTSRGWVNPFAP